MTLIFVFLGVISFYLIVVDKSKINELRISKLELDQLLIFFSKTFHFFNLLDEKEKRKFIKRVILIRRKKYFKINTEINTDKREVELLISAAFAQITFGFQKFHLRSFEAIIVYPNSFYSSLVDAQVKGLTVGTGFIYFSWEDFIKGYIHDDDKINLAIHEMAHALYIDRFHKSDKLIWEKWVTIASSVYKRINEEESHVYFRSYALHNINEFWAVCIEYFFEDPLEFRSEYRELYTITSLLLNQDMALRKEAFISAN